MPDARATVGRSLFMTGGTGFLGKSLLKRLARPDLAHNIGSITVLSRNPNEFLKRHPEFSHIRNLSFVRGGLLDFEDSGKRYTHVIHAATDTSIEALSNPLRQFDEIVTGTRRMLDFSVAVGATRFLLTSSGAVYGPQPTEMNGIPESYSGAPSTMESGTTYGTSKRMAEHLCRIYNDQYGLDCLIARCFAFVGEYMPLHGHYAMGNFLRDAMSESAKEITVHGDGTAIRSYLHADDLADWLLRILEDGLPCHPYNVGSEERISISDLAFLIRDLLAPSKAVRITRLRSEFTGRSIYVPSLERIRKELSVTETRSLKESILSVAATLGN